MLTFYYMNREEIDRQYAQTVPFVISSYEKYVQNTTKLAGKLTIGAFLQFLGLNLGGADISGEWDRDSGSKIIHAFTHEQKLALVWKGLQDKNQLTLLTTSGSPNLRIGEPVLFEGSFAVCDISDEIAGLDGRIGEEWISITFSKAKVPASVLAALVGRSDNVPISGYGIIMKLDHMGVMIRPVAFGLGFSQVLGLESRQP